MLEFIGLPWDPICIDFQNAKRTVITASKWQVRQKISMTHRLDDGATTQRYLGPLESLLREPAHWRGN